MGRWDITANRASIKIAGATARSTKWYIVNDPYGKADRMNEVNKEMVNELIFDILDYRKKKKMCRIICTCQNFIVPLQRILL